MTLNVDWGILNINVPRDQLLVIQTTPVEIRELNLEDFRLAMHEEQDSDEGMAYLHMHEHNPPVEVAGVVLAQVVTIVNDYTVTFEDGDYNVNIVGGNSNVADVTIKNQVGVNSANSAGLQDSTILQAGSFGGQVVIDAINGVTGTTFPRGTKRLPCLNLTDAIWIAEREGIDKFLFYGNYTVVEDVAGYKLYGQNAVLTTLTIDNLADVTNCQIVDATLTGTLDGGTLLERGQTSGINYVNGIVYNTALNINPIILGGSQQAMFLNCSSSVAGNSTPTIDMNGTGQSLAMRNYSGGIRIMNRTGVDDVSIDMTSGHVIIDSTSNGNPITIRGSFKLTVEAGGTIPDTLGRTAMESSVIDGNIVSVYGMDIFSADDFKADVSTIDLSTVPADVWAHATRELTATLGLTPAQEAKLDQLSTDIAGVPDAVLDEVAP